MKFAINNNQDKQQLFNYLKELEHNYIVEVKKKRNNRSINQNNYYWSCIVQPLSQELGYYNDEIHDILKLKFASEYNTFLRGEKMVGIQMVNSTARMNTQAFELYCEQIRIWAMTELGIRLMLPNEYS